MVTPWMVNINADTNEIGSMVCLDVPIDYFRESTLWDHYRELLSVLGSAMNFVVTVKIS